MVNTSVRIQPVGIPKAFDNSIDNPITGNLDLVYMVVAIRQRID